MEEEDEPFEVEENDGNRDRDKFFIKEKYNTVRKLKNLGKPTKNLYNLIKKPKP